MKSWAGLMGRSISLLALPAFPEHEWSKLYTNTDTAFIIFSFVQIYCTSSSSPIDQAPNWI